jgi:hypothetical protein
MLLCAEEALPNPIRRRRAIQSAPGPAGFSAIPKSTIHTSPRLISGIVSLHTVQQQGPFERCLVAQLDLLALRAQFEETPPNHSPLAVTELWQFV